MRARLTLTIACLSLCSQVATARQILLSCDAFVDPTGTPTRRDISIDTERRIVRDNRFTWRDGSDSPMANSLEEFVEIQDEFVSWGNRHKEGGDPTSVFTLDLRSGVYLLRDRDGQLSHGMCKQPAGMSEWLNPSSPFPPLASKVTGNQSSDGLVVL